MSDETGGQHHHEQDHQDHQEEEDILVKTYLGPAKDERSKEEIVAADRAMFLKLRRLSIIDRTSKMLVRYRPDAIRAAMRSGGVNGYRRLLTAAVAESIGPDKEAVKCAKSDQLGIHNSLACFQCGYFLEKNAIWDIAKEQERLHLREPMKKELHFRTVPVDQGEFCEVIEPEFCFICHEASLLPHYDENLTKTPSETWEFTNFLELCRVRGQAAVISQHERNFLGIPDDRILRRRDLPAPLMEPQPAAITCGATTAPAGH